MTDTLAAPRRSWIVALLTAVLVLLTVTPTLPVAAATPSPETPAGELTLTLAPVGNGIVRPGEVLSVSVSLSNGTAAEAPASEVVLEVGTAALPDRAGLTGWLTGDGSGRELAVLGTAATEPVEPGERATTGLMVPAENPLLTERAPGVYPLRATATYGTDTLVATSVLVVPDDAVAPIGVGVVVPITAPPSTEGLLSSDELLALTAPDGDLSAQLEAVDGTGAILAIDPAIPAAIRALGTSAPESVTAWLARLDALPNERFALQFGDADIAAQIDSGLAAPLAPLSLQPYLTAADFIPDAAATPTPTPTANPAPAADGATPSPTPTTAPAPGEPVYPALGELLAVDGARPGTYWPFTGTAGTHVVSALGALSTGDLTTVTLVSSATTAQGANVGTVPARAQVDAASALVYDSAISDALHRASLVDESAIRAAALTEATAHLAFAVRESDGRPLLVTLDRGDGRSRLGITTALSTVESAPGVATTGLDALVAGEATGVSIADAASDEARTAAVTALRQEEASLTDFATILDDPGVLTSPERAEILQLLGGGWLPEPAMWQTALTEHRDATTRTLGSVSIPQLTDINLVGQNVPLRIFVRNSLQWPVNVVLIAQPGDPRLLVQRATTVRAAPDSNTRVEIPVEAHVGNGEVDLRLELLSPSYLPIGASQTATVMVRADWEVIGIAALAVVVGGLLVIGLVRTVRRRRRARADETATAAPDETATDDTAADTAPDDAGTTADPDGNGQR